MYIQNKSPNNLLIYPPSRKVLENSWLSTQEKKKVNIFWNFIKDNLVRKKKKGSDPKGGLLTFIYKEWYNFFVVKTQPYIQILKH